MPDPSRTSFCPRCGKRFDYRPPKRAEELVEEHMKNCTDISEEYRGEIDSS